MQYAAPSGIGIAGVPGDDRAGRRHAEHDETDQRGSARVARTEQPAGELGGGIAREVMMVGEECAGSIMGDDIDGVAARVDHAVAGNE